MQRRVYVRLDEVEIRRLVEEARMARRHPADHAAKLIIDALRREGARNEPPMLKDVNAHGR